MICKFSLSILAFVGLSLAAQGQEKDKVVPVKFRAVLHDPVHPIANLFYADEDGAIQKINFRPKDLSEELLTLPVNGSLVLYDKANIDPENPAASMAAGIQLPVGIEQAIIVVLPSPAEKKPAYQLLVINDSKKSFPKGTSLALSLVGVETAIQAGEHKLPIQPGKITKVPPVKKVNKFHMAQTNFYYQQGEAWIPFTERQLQYIDACRRLFIIHATPGAIQPTITTIVDIDRG